MLRGCGCLMLFVCMAPPPLLLPWSPYSYPTLWMALTLNIGTSETEWGRFWEKQQKWFRKERGWCMWRDKKGYIYLTGLGDSWERMWTPKRAKNGLSVSGGSLQLQHQYLSLWSHAEIPQGFIECGRLCFCSQCVSRGCVLSGSVVRQEPEGAVLVPSSELVRFGIIVGSHQMNGIRQRDTIFIPERDLKDHLMVIFYVWRLKLQVIMWSIQSHMAKLVTGKAERHPD